MYVHLTQGNEVYDSTTKAVISLYEGKTTRDDFEAVFQNFYHEDASFNDPIVSVKGVANVRTQFYSLRQLFTSHEITSKPVVTAGAMDKNTLSIEMTAQFTVLGLLPIRLKQITRINLCPNTARIIAHRDMWCLPDSLLEYPIIGTAYQLAKLGFGAYTTALCRLIQPTMPARKKLE
ncbi:hypothetical protein SARC_10403 [Sphaeroforma arctica JP610]|uniref:SigF-like NTF2-like domain-containing protein n=1 Tax=Sphaeroforma arctica JP610 TaxID=667725 RepID=A0A0L0FK56_9EUKA|nr:hypothetical protein SARC_10403 [Sphaeroforma arctica JP610]KNC77130.1 hypothetical protein SARC_10403 [Sphaeroforma arctica JP610]|eukprot:XP_014151032.1 hypothetical protein SARC_10403 [Sphaeroforma arctica JP610]